MPNAKRKPAGKPRPAGSKDKSPARARTNHQAEGDFPSALAELLRSRKIAVPKGLEDAPPEAYAHQPVSFVEELAKHSDAELKLFAGKVAGYAERQHARVQAAWNSHPLIAELARRKLKAPPVPKRVVGLSVSLSQLREWTDKQLLKAANDLSKRGS